MWNGCLAVLMTALVLVLFGMWRLSTASGRADGRARERMKESVEQTRDLLSQAASDGSLLGTEIDRSTRGGNGKASAAEAQRHGRRVTVTEPFAIVEGGWYSGSASGCYRFDLVPASSPPPVSVHELSDALCRDRSATTRYRDPRRGRRDVVVELRAAVTRGGLTGVQNASVWQTGGIVRTGQETKHGQLITLALLSRGSARRTVTATSSAPGRSPSPSPPGSSGRTAAIASGASNRPGRRPPCGPNSTPTPGRSSTGSNGRSRTGP